MALPELFTCVLMVMAVYEEERRRVERNMLALSNLNLAASGFAGGEIQKMLGQALDRVLNVVRIPAGVLCVQQAEPRASNSVIVTGLSEDLAQTIHDGNLDEYMVNLVARLGGLVVLRDLVRDANWEALEQEEPFRQVRQLLLGHGLRTVVGISLQAKERVFRRVAAGDAGQSQLHSRGASPADGARPADRDVGREQLPHAADFAPHARSCISSTKSAGRSSSTLELDALLERIYSEMRRVLDVASFFIAYLRCKNQRSALRDRSHRWRAASRSARVPPGNHLVEYVVRSGQPLLIREHFREETQRLGIEPLRDASARCAVPLILYDQPVGVMVIHSPKERIFDEGHVELLRRARQRGGHCDRKRAALRRRAEKVPPADADQQRLKPRHHHSRSR